MFLALYVLCMLLWKFINYDIIMKKKQRYTFSAENDII